MSYEIAVQRARATIAGAPTRLPDFAAVHAALEKPQPRPSRTRRVIATVGALAAALTMLLDAAISVQWGAPVLVTLAVPVVLLLASSVWIQRPTFSSQLLARAVWWAYLVFGVIWSLGPADSLPLLGGVVSAGCGIGLLAAERHGLMRGGTGERFDPVAVRGTLIVSIIVAMADAQVLGLLSTVGLEAGVSTPRNIGLGVCALGLATGAWGLSRLRAWALGLNLVATVAGLTILVAAPSSGGALAPVLGSSLVVQLLLPVRIAWTRRTGVRPGPVATTWIASAVVVATMSLAVVIAVVRTFFS